jgi:uncharacterized protein (TIGR03435 family)
MRQFLTIPLIIAVVITNAQPILRPGDPFPAMIIRNIVNAPVKQLDVQTQNTKFLILNFWGTWCSPCLPEMDSLEKLQVKNNEDIQVIGISDEPVERLEKYLQRKPSTLWLASDTSGNLYRQFALNYVGQAAIIDRRNRIIAVVRTDSINQQLIDKLTRGDSIRSSAEVGNQADIESDPFAVDSTLGFQVTFSSYRPGLPGMSKSYLKTAFEGRRLTYINTCLADIFKSAYGVSYKQVVYEIPEKSVCNWDDKSKSTLYCFDILVKPTQKDSLKIIMLQALDRLSPVKARLEKREIPVYLLRRLSGATGWPVSLPAENTYSFSGRGFDGKGIPIKPFVDYVANELQLPVVDETGLTGKYDIVAELSLRTEADMLAALKKLGLTVEKTSRKMDVVVFYR